MPTDDEIAKYMDENGIYRVKVRVDPVLALLLGLVDEIDTPKEEEDANI